MMSLLSNIHCKFTFIISWRVADWGEEGSQYSYNTSCPSSPPM